MPLAGALEHLAEVAPRSERLWSALRSLGPALAAHPAALARLAPPPAVAAEWQRDLRRTRAQNVVLLAELEHALAALDATGVPALVYKGAAALDRLYPDPGVRPMDDADVLVRPSDRDRAAEALRRLGFARRPDEAGRFGHAPDGEWTFDRHAAIDVHWHVVADQRLRGLFPGSDDASVWTRAADRRLEPADAVLVTATAQALGHPWSHPLGYLDLHLALRDADPDALRARARRAGLGSLLWWSMRFAARLFGGPEPPSALAPEPLARRLGEMLVGGDWLGVAPFRREMPARDLFVALLAGPGALGRSLAASGPRSAGGTARAAISIAWTAARALAS